jgi:hypothetical protein
MMCVILGQIQQGNSDKGPEQTENSLLFGLEGTGWRPFFFAAKRWWTVWGATTPSQSIARLGVLAWACRQTSNSHSLCRRVWVFEMAGKMKQGWVVRLAQVIA